VLLRVRLAPLVLIPQLQQWHALFVHPEHIPRLQEAHPASPVLPAPMLALWDLLGVYLVMPELLLKLQAPPVVLLAQQENTHLLDLTPV